MGKKCISIVVKKKLRMIYCEDLQKIHYLKRKKTPKLPAYENHEDDFTISSLNGTEPSFTPEQLNTEPQNKLLLN